MNVKSPCIDKCDLNPDNDVCNGCFRTSDEIAQWMDYPDERKKKILKLIKIRKNV